MFHIGSASKETGLYLHHAYRIFLRHLCLPDICVSAGSKAVKLCDLTGQVSARKPSHKEVKIGSIVKYKKQPAESSESGVRIQIFPINKGGPAYPRISVHGCMSYIVL